MKIYLAHNFDARIMLRSLIKEWLLDHEITSSWIYDDSHIDGGQTRIQSAECDIKDIDRADCFLLFVDQFAERVGRGKWFEWGYATARNKLVLLVGNDDGCIFYHLPYSNVYKFYNLAHVAKWLDERKEKFDPKEPKASKSIP